MEERASRPLRLYYLNVLSAGRELLVRPSGISLLTLHRSDPVAIPLPPVSVV